MLNTLGSVVLSFVGLMSTPCLSLTKRAEMSTTDRFFKPKISNFTYPKSSNTGPSYWVTAESSPPLIRGSSFNNELATISTPHG